MTPYLQTTVINKHIHDKMSPHMAPDMNSKKVLKLSKLNKLHLKNWLYNFLYIISYSLITVTSMFLSLLVTLCGPLACFMVQMNVPWSSGFTKPIRRLPLDTWVNRFGSKDFLPFLLQEICGLGVPSALQLIMPDVCAIKVCWSNVFWVNLAVKSSNEKHQYHSYTVERSEVSLSYMALLSLFLQDKKMCFHTINIDNVILNIFQSLAFICSSIRQLYIIDEQITIVSSPDPLRSRVCYFKLSPIDDPSSMIGFIVYRAVKLFSATNIKIEFISFQHFLVFCKKNSSV